MRDWLAFVWTRVSGPLGTILRTAVGAALVVVIGWGPDVLTKSAADWRFALGVAVAAAFKVAYNYFDPGYTRYGKAAAPSVTERVRMYTDA